MDAPRRCECSDVARMAYGACTLEDERFIASYAHSLRSTFRSARNCVRRQRVSAIAATEELLGVAVTNPVL